MLVNKKKTLDELKIFVFEKNQATKQNKDKLFKLAKAQDNIDIIKKLRDKLQFKSAKVYLEKYYHMGIDEAIRNRDLKSLKRLIGKGTDVSHINLVELVKKKYPIEYFQILLKAKSNIHKTDDDGRTALVMAIMQNHTELVNMLLNNGANANDKAYSGETALQIASSLGNEDIVTSLLQYEADINSVTNDKLTPLLLAVWKNHLSIVKKLLANRADLNIVDIHGVTPLIRASCEGHYEIVQFLIAQGVDINQKDNSGFSALDDAMMNSHKKIIDILLEHGAKKPKNTTNNNFENNITNLIPASAKSNNSNKTIVKRNISPLLLACYSKNYNKVKKILQINLENINSENKDGITPLINSIDTPKILELLLESGVDANYKNQHDATALIAAVQNGFLDSVKLLIQYGAEINLCSKTTSPLTFSIFNKHNEVAKYLIEKGADINLKHMSNMNAFKTAIGVENYEMANFLCEHDVQVDIDKDKDFCYSLLNSSSHHGYIPILKQLMKHKINLNILTDGYTPLMVAVEGKQTEIVKFLIQNNANVDVCNESNWTPLMDAIYSEEYDIAKLLIENDSDINIVNAEGGTALMFAIQNGNKEIVEMLIGTKVNINYIGLNTFPLMMAVANKSVDILQLLLDNNVEMDQQNQDGYTALMIAAENENTDALKLLIEKGADTTLKKYDYDYDDEDEEHDTGHGNSALDIAIHKNDWETNDNIEAIKLILETRETITSGEAGGIDILLSYEEIAKVASKILVDMDGWFMTTLMYTLMINGVLWRGDFLSFSEKSEEERKKDADEYMKYNILLNCKSLLENGVDINYEGGDTSALGQAKSMGMEEVIELLQSYLEKNTLKLSGFITINEGKYTIQVKDKEIVFIDTVDTKVEKFQKDLEVKNRYVNSDSYIEISKGKVTHSISHKTIEYEIDSISGNPIETDDNHNPQLLVKTLNLFTKENPIKHSAHSFEWNKYGSYKIFMEQVKKEFVKVENNLKILSLDLHTKINKFLFDENLDENNTWGMSKMDFGWSSPELKEWCSIEDSKVNGKKAINFLLPKQYQKEIGDKTLVSFEDVCSVLKNEIEIRDDDKLKMLFATIKKDVLKFDFEVRYKNLENISFYTDVENFKNGLTLIFEQFKEDGREQYDTIEIEAIPNESDNYIDIRIMQVGSTVGKKSNEMENEIEDGTFRDIKNHFSSLCDWGIEASFGDGNFRVNYLSSNENNKKPIPLKKDPLGFTHILRFYK